MKVYTTKGILESENLEIKDEVSMKDNARVFTTEWYFKGELVRRDVNVNLLVGLSVSGESNTI